MPLSIRQSISSFLFSMSFSFWESLALPIICVSVCLMSSSASSVILFFSSVFLISSSSFILFRSSVHLWFIWYFLSSASFSISLSMSSACMDSTRFSLDIFAYIGYNFLRLFNLKCLFSLFFPFLSLKEGF